MVSREILLTVVATCMLAREEQEEEERGEVEIEREGGRYWFDFHEVWFIHELWDESPYCGTKAQETKSWFHRLRRMPHFSVLEE